MGLRNRNLADFALNSAMNGLLNISTEKAERGLQAGLERSWQESGYSTEDYAERKRAGEFSCFTIEKESDFAAISHHLNESGIPFAATQQQGTFYIEMESKIQANSLNEYYRINYDDEQRRQAEERVLQAAKDAEAAANNAAVQRINEMYATEEQRTAAYHQYGLDDTVEQQRQQEEEAARKQQEEYQRQQEDYAYQQQQLEQQQLEQQRQQAENERQQQQLQQQLQQQEKYIQSVDYSAQSTDVISAATIMQQICKYSDTYAEDYHNVSAERIEDVNKSVEGGSFGLKNEVMQSLDYLGRAMQSTNSLLNDVNAYSENNNDVFHKNELNFNHKVGKGSAEALVISDAYGNYHVIANGKEISGTPAKEVLAAHENRLQKAEKLAEGVDWSDESATFLQRNAAAVRDDIYGVQSYSVSTAEFLNKDNLITHTNDVYKLDTIMDAAVATLNNQIIINEYTSRGIDTLVKADLDLMKQAVNTEAGLMGIATSELEKRAFTRLKSDEFAFNLQERVEIGNTIDAINEKLLKKKHSIEKSLTTGEITVGGKKRKLSSSELTSLQDEKKKLEKRINNNKTVRNKLRLTDTEKRAYNHSEGLLAAIRKDFGIDVSPTKPITKKQLIEINRNVLEKALANNIPLVRKSGKVDVERLRALTDKEMKLLGISEKTKELLVSINSKNAISGDGIGTGIIHKAGHLFSRVDDNEAVSDFRRDVGQLKNFGKHTKSVATTVYKTKYVHVADIKATLKNGNFKDLSEKIKERQQADKARKAAEKQKQLKDNAKRMAKKTKRDEKALAKASKRKHLRKFQARVNNAKARLARSKIGKLLNFGNKIKAKITGLLLKIGAYAGGGIVIMAGAAIAVVLVLTVIQSILQLPLSIAMKLSEPEDYTETVVYSLYAHMDALQGQWLSDILEYDDDYVEKKSELHYGINNEDFTTYVNSQFNGKLYIKGNDLYVNPFMYAKGDGTYIDMGKSNVSKLTEINTYNGRQVFSLAANPSMYTKKAQPEEGITYNCIEDGHTNNIKDIICMIDVMYQFQIADLFNDSGGQFESILGKSPAQVDIMNTWNHIITGLKWIGNAILNVITFGLFSDPEEGIFPSYTTYWRNHGGGSVGYEAVQTYATLLWQSSHQQSIGLQVEYYDVSDVKVKKNGVESVVTPAAITEEEKTTWAKAAEDFTTRSAQISASEYGKCIDPIHKEYPVFKNSSNKIEPYITYKGNKYDLSTGNFDITISREKNYFDNDLCLWDGMSANQSTLTKIQNYMKKHAPSKSPSKDAAAIDDATFNACWKEPVSSQQLKDGRPSELSYSLMSSVKWNDEVASDNVKIAYKNPTSGSEYSNLMSSRDEAFSEVYTKLQSKYSSHTVKADTYYMTNDCNEFAHFSSKKPLFDPDITVKDEKVKDSVTADVTVTYITANGAKKTETAVATVKIGTGTEAEAKAAAQKKALEEIQGRIKDKVWELSDSEKIGGWTGWNIYTEEGNSWSYWTRFKFGNYSSPSLSAYRGNVGVDETSSTTHVDSWSAADVEKTTNAETKEKYFTLHKNITFMFWCKADTDYTTNYVTKYKAKGSAMLEKRYVDVFKRNCQQHEFVYCGGHVCFHSQGLIYSMTNEQLVMSGAYDSKTEATKPIASHFDMKKGYSQMVGKHDKSRAGSDNLKTIVAYANQITADGVLVNNKQGTYIGSHMGVEFWMDGEMVSETSHDPIQYEFTGDDDDLVKGGEAWYDGDNDDCEYEKASSVFMSAQNRCMDIFDVDTGLLKADCVFPVTKANIGFASFEGWSAQNMQAACIKFAMDWYNLYEFDIPIEISQRHNTLCYGSALTFEIDDEGNPKEAKVMYNGLTNTEDDENGTPRMDGSWDENQSWTGDKKLADKTKLEYITKWEYDDDGNIEKDDDGNRVKTEMWQAGFRAYEKEYGGDVLSSDDIKKIVEAVGNYYGDDFTNERASAVITTLQWVGRGHYSEYHTDHCFLCKTCKSSSPYNKDGSKSDDGIWLITADDKEVPFRTEKNCTAGNSTDFAKFVYYRQGAFTDDDIKKSVFESIGYSSSTILNNDWILNVKDKNDPMPADAIIHKNVYDHALKNVDIGNADERKIYEYLGMEALRKELNTQVVIFVGISGTDLTLSTGQEIKAGVPITVELTLENKIGNIWLHTQEQSDLFDYGTDKTPYWVTNPDSRTHVMHIDFPVIEEETEEPAA